MVHSVQVANEKVSLAGEFLTKNEEYQINGRESKWRDGFRIKGSIRTDQLPAHTTYNEKNASLDGIYYRLRGEMTIDPHGILFLPDGEERYIRIYNSQLPDEGLDFVEIDTYHRTVYRGIYKPGLIEEE
jgi:hypothetical protein